MEKKEKKQRIGVYICHCGGNISDYVDVAQIKDLIKDEDGVIVSKNVMFACADSNQTEMIKDIEDEKLDAIVVASCSPKLHLHTFRNVAKRAGLNPYNYTQVNIREQCSWAHSDTPGEATQKATGLIRAGVTKVSHSEALEPIEVSTTKAAVVIGAGVSGMRAAIDLARMGNQVYLIEKEKTAGGNVGQWGELFISGQRGDRIVGELLEKIRGNSNITLFTEAVIANVSGSLGNFNVETHVRTETLHLKAGAILVTTGFEPYLPGKGMYGYEEHPSVVTLPEFKKRMDDHSGNELVYQGRTVRRIAYIYCVGMRETAGENKYCSRVCCTSAIHNSVQLRKKFDSLSIYHIYRDIRTYGKQELLYEESSKSGDIYIKFNEKNPPVVEVSGIQLTIRVKDELTRQKELEVPVDLIVLVTGMIPRKDSAEISGKLKIPVGNDRFFNEIHPKLRPVETVINGVFLGGSCQGPKNISESVQSSLAASVKINALTKNPKIQLEPIIARVNYEVCTWCGKCEEVCEYDAISQLEMHGKTVASVNKATCTGCGICTPVCPVDAVDVAQYSNDEIEGMIDGFAQEVQIQHAEKTESGDEEVSYIAIKDMPAIWREISTGLESGNQTIPELVKALGRPSELLTYHLMTMNKYGIVDAQGIDDNDEYYLYKMKYPTPEK